MTAPFAEAALFDAHDEQLATPLDAHLLRECRADCRSYVVNELCGVIRKALARIADELAETAANLTQRDQQQAMMDAVSVVRQHRGELEECFRTSFQDHYDRRMRGLGDGAARVQLDLDASQMTLVDNQVIDERLSIDRLVHKARGRLDPEEVLGVRARLAALIERDWFDESRHPVAPEAVFAALKQAVDRLAPRAEVQAALLEAIEPHLSSQLNGIYSNVNARLKARQVLPRVRRKVAPQQETVRGAGGHPAPVGEGLAPGRGAAWQAGSQMTGYPATGYPAAGYPAAAGAIPGGAAGAAGSMMGAAVPGMASAGGMAGMDAGASGPIPLWTTSLDQLAQGIPGARTSVARLLTDPESFGVADLPVPDVAAPLIESLSALQADRPSFVASARPALLAELVSHARTQGSPLDQLTVEIVSMVFDYIYADKRLSDIVKQQLMRLQVVAVKAALLDRSFFARRAHPMRRLIDRISEMGADPDVDLTVGSVLAISLERVIDWVVAEFDSDLATFEQALDRLESLLEIEGQRQADKLQRLQEDAERQETRLVHRSRARALLEQRCGTDTASFVREFLCGSWSQVMAEIAMSRKPSADPYDSAALRIAESLVWSVTPKLPEEIEPMAAMLPKLIRGLGDGMRLVQFPEAEREAFFEELLQTHTKLISSARQQGGRRNAVFIATSTVRMHADGELRFHPVRQRGETEEPALASVDLTPRRMDFEKGEHLDVEEQGEVLRYKLAWVSPSRQLFVLTRSPGQARSLAAEEFNRLVDEGLIRAAPRATPVQRVIDALARDDVEGQPMPLADDPVELAPQH